VLVSIAFAPNGKLVAIGLNTGKVRLLNVENPQDLKITCGKLLAFDSGISSLSFSPNGKLLAAGAGKGISGPKDFGTFNVLEVKSGKEVFRNTSLSIIYNLSFSSDGQVLAVAGAKNSKAGTKLTLNLFAADRWATISKFNEYPVGVGLSFSKDGCWLVSAFPNPPGAEIAIMDSLNKRTTHPINTKTALTALAVAPQ
jgi:WD40 repeat protein